MLIINLADIQGNVHNIDLLFLSIALEICLPTANVIFFESNSFFSLNGPEQL